jgi:hypothetical protein
MDATLFLANFIAGVHSVLIVYFLIGWLIPFTPFKWRLLSNVIIGLGFLYYRFNGGCFLTHWEMGLRSIATPDFHYGPSFLFRLSSNLGLGLDANFIDSIAFYVTLVLLGVGIILVVSQMMSFKIKSKGQK